MSKLVTIIIPSYNAEKWLDSAMNSALNQTWKQKEIIIVDDGSKDGTLRIAKKYESHTVKVFTQENRGASSARNRGLSIAQGDYIQWLDSDDLLSPDKIELQLINSDGKDDDLILLSSAWGKFQYRKEEARNYPNCLWQDLNSVEWLINKMNNNAWMAIESWLVSRKLTEMAGPWDERLSLDDDGEYFGRVVANCSKVEFIKEAKSYCRRSIANSLSSVASISKDKIQSQYLSICMQINNLLSLEDSARTRIACLKLLQDYLIYFFPEEINILEKANELANSLGGKLIEPELTWKYSIIKNIFGWRLAKRTYFLMPSIKIKVKNSFQKIIDSQFVDNN